jgi:hypothetical protein
MREILQAELSEHVRVPVDAIDPEDLANSPAIESWLIAALTMRAVIVRQRLPAGANCVALRLRSIPGSLQGETSPGPNATICITSGSPEFRHWARSILIAVGLDPESLFEVDPALPGWQERAIAGTIVITDALVARHFSAGSRGRVFRIISDSSLAEIKQLCNA